MRFSMEIAYHIFFEAEFCRAEFSLAHGPEPFYSWVDEDGVWKYWYRKEKRNGAGN